MRYWEDCRAFFREFREQYHDTGSILPSSRFLGRALVSEIRKPRGPARILEVGPGTGPVTAETLRQLRPADRQHQPWLDRVEHQMLAAIGAIYQSLLEVDADHVVVVTVG